MLKVRFLGLEMAFIRMKRLKTPTLLTSLTIALILSIIISLTWGSTIAQENMVLNAFDSILTDFNMRIIDKDSSDIDIQALADIISNVSNVDRSLIKLFPNPTIFEGSFLLSRNSTVNLPKNQNFDSFTTLFGFSGVDFEYYQNIINQESGIDFIKLSDNDTVISSVTAKRLNLTVGDSLFITHQGFSNASSIFEDNSSLTFYCVKVVKIWDLTFTDDVFNDITEIPLQRIHEFPKITDFVLMGDQTYLNCMTHFFQELSNTTILNNGIISVFINRESLINRYNITSMINRLSQITNNLWLGIEHWKPVYTEIIWSNNLENEITIILEKISEFTFIFNFFGFFLLCTLLIFYYIFVQLRIHQSRHHLGLMKLRGSSNSLVYSNIIFEGGLQGFFGGLIGIPFSLGLLIGIDYYFYPSILVENLFFDLIFSNLISLFLTNIMIGMILGLFGCSFLIFFYVNDLSLKDQLIGIENFNNHSKNKNLGNWRYFLIFSLITIISWIFLKILDQYDMGGAWSYFLLITQDILSLLLLLTPFSLIIGILGLIVHKRDRIEKFFSPLTNIILKDLTNLFFKNFWRRSKHSSILIFLTTLITVSTIASTILVINQKKIAEKNIIKEFGSDIRLNGKFRQFNTKNFRNFMKNNSGVINSSSYFVYQRGSFFGGPEGTVSTPVIALSTPTSYLNTILFEDLSISIKRETEELLNLVIGKKIIVPFEYYEKYNWNIGDIRRVTLSSSVSQETVDFSIVGFYQSLPGLELSKRLSPNGIICDFDYLVNQTNLLDEMDTTFMIRLIENISIKVKDYFYQVIRSNFHFFEIIILENKINEYKNSFEGKLPNIIDIIFHLAVILGSVGISWFILSILQNEKQELAILRSRGIKKKSILKFNITRILLIEILGIGIGIIVGIIVIVVYIESLLPNFSIYGDLLLILPIIKVISFLTFMIVTHFLVTLITLLLWSRHNIIDDLTFKE